jgi:hypothetical protein
LLGDHVDIGNIFIGNNGRRNATVSLGTEKVDVVAKNDRSKNTQAFLVKSLNPTIAKPSYLPEVGTGLVCVSVSKRCVYTNDANTISWLHLVNQIVIKDNINGSRQLTSRSPLRHFLNADNLMITIDAVSKLCTKRISFGIFCRVDGASGDNITEGCAITVLACVMNTRSVGVVNGFHHLGSNERA